MAIKRMEARYWILLCSFRLYGCRRRRLANFERDKIELFLATMSHAIRFMLYCFSSVFFITFAAAVLLMLSRHTYMYVKNDDMFGGKYGHVLILS